MRTLSVMVAALSLGACAAQPPTLADTVAQIRGGFSAAGCAGGFSNGPAQPKCLSTDAAAQSKPNVQAGEARSKQQLVNVHPPVFNTLGQAPPPKLDGDQRAWFRPALLPLISKRAAAWRKASVPSGTWVSVSRWKAAHAISLLTNGPSSQALTVHTACDTQRRVAAELTPTCSLAWKWR
jgi:hypothetical protein